MSADARQRYVESDGMKFTGAFPVRFELVGQAVGKRRNEVSVGIVEPVQCRMWDIASDEAAFHGGDESAPKPLALFTAGVVTCFMTQMRTFARHCGVDVRALRAEASFQWTGRRAGQDPYTAHPKQFGIDIRLETDSPLEAQQQLVRAAAKGCFAEQILAVGIVHRLWHEGKWIICDVD